MCGFHQDVLFRVQTICARLRRIAVNFCQPIRSDDPPLSTSACDDAPVILRQTTYHIGSRFRVCGVAGGYPLPDGLPEGAPVAGSQSTLGPGWWNTGDGATRCRRPASIRVSVCFLRNPNAQSSRSQRQPRPTLLDEAAQAWGTHFHKVVLNVLTQFGGPLPAGQLLLRLIIPRPRDPRLVRFGALGRVSK